MDNVPGHGNSNKDDGQGPKTEDSNAVAANGSSEADNHTTNRAPISSAPQDVVDVGSATPDARKRGWWSRGE